jgi:NADH-quinone oxidoreductase subunit A
METQAAAYLSLAYYLFLALLTIGAVMLFSYLFGLRHTNRFTGEPYESGVATTGTTRIRFDVKYYLVAMFFVIFDLEAAFIYVWAISVRETGWAGYIEILVFTGVLFAALIYLWKLGALEWADTRRREYRSFTEGASS